MKGLFSIASAMGIHKNTAFFDRVFSRFLLLSHRPLRHFLFVLRISLEMFFFGAFPPELESEGCIFSALLRSQITSEELIFCFFPVSFLFILDKVSFQK